MNISGLLPLLQTHPEYRRVRQALTDALGSGPQVVLADDVLDAAKPYLLAALSADPELPARRILVLTARPERATEVAAALDLYAPEGATVLRFPAPDLLPYERIAPDPTITSGRLEVLAALVEPESVAPAQNSKLIIASAQAVMMPTLAPADFRWATRTVRRSEIIDVNDLLSHWVDLGYEPASVVEDAGSFSRRGGIIDVWPVTSPRPVRIELWGDEIESLRLFNPDTQRSEAQIEALTVPPSCELPLWRRDPALAALRDLDCATCRPEVQEEWARQMEQLAAGECFEGQELFAPYFTTPLASLLDYLQPSDLLIVDGPEGVRLAASELERGAEELYQEFVNTGELPPQLRAPYVQVAALLPLLAPLPRLELGALAEGAAEAHLRSLPPFEPPRLYSGNIAAAIEDVRAMLADGQRVVIVSQQAERLRDLFEEEDVYPTRRKTPPGSSPRQDGAAREPSPKAKTPNPKSDGLNAPLLDPPSGGALHLVLATLDEGWRCFPMQLTLLTDLELFGRQQPRRRAARQTTGRTAAIEEFLRDLKPGDYVVHIEHGIARYNGLVKRSVGGAPPQRGRSPLPHTEDAETEREYMLLEYAEGDRLFVPIEQVDRVSAYIGTGNASPGLHRLGSAEWARTKRRVTESTVLLARELLALYAAREAAPGFAYSPDSLWQQELEDAFPYVETEDQMRAIEEVKTDMEQARPMDRLICGDVGYGKTEVAVRAAFKAVLDGRQVAVLVPTTILAQQHLTTFQNRMGAFPVKIEMLSRFRNRREQAAIVDALREGKLDIVIGTHRLLQKDIVFKDLGLVVVDEEQRFGVRHKERLKQLRQQVDVLTMSATPIPRTLYMAMAGVRDMSLIETPPQERLPIKTYVTAYRDPLVKEVIQREIERGGQVFFVHNRVQSIGIVLRELQKLLPEVRFVVGHGQMEEDQLEQVMTDFITRKYDVLICTTIIESGLDIPNANTLIVDQAQTFGLAQLYQLRGRVGRGTNRAYAYFLYHTGRRVTEIAQERLHTIEQATELGAGFRIALKDLELRGAGNLLGPEQHGQVAAVGLDLYTRLLSAAVEEAKGHARPEEPPPVTLDLPLTAFLPESYVPDAAVRLQLYQRLSRTRTDGQVRELRRELEDRFGPLPAPAQTLLTIVQLKALCLDAGVESIGTVEDEFVIQLTAKAAQTRDLAPVHDRLRRRLKDAARLTPRQVRLWRPRLGTDWLATVRQVLEELAEAA